MRAKLEKLLAPKQTVYVFSSHFRWNQGLGDTAGNKPSRILKLYNHREGPYYANQPARPLDLKPIEQSVLNVKAVVATQPARILGPSLCCVYTTSHFAKVRFQLHWASI